MEQKLCRICGKLKNIEVFSKCEKMKDGHRNECKDCSNNNINKKRMKELDEQRIIKIEGTKICLFCKMDKDFNDFHIKRRSADGRSNKCKSCMKIILKKYKEVPGFKEKDKNYQKKRYDLKRDQLLVDKKKYYQENRDKLLAYKKEYRNSPNFKENDKKWRSENKELLAQLQADYRSKYPHIIAWRSVLYSTLKRLNTIKEGHTIDMLGYSALQLKEHIEKQFVEGMTWENHGDWHIDHKKAVSTFEDTADIKVVCALDNLQPLWAFDNLSKNRY